ncbi:hypothetical protein [Tropicibacter sp. S64]|uniref:hypothetical protein n=1 Tax=Tropicibacter sp. S64 TaxID=3415122 RepID=UPI003C7AA15A
MKYFFRKMPVSRFREEAGKSMQYVEKFGGHLWLTRHGKFVGAVIPFYQLRVLESILDEDMTNHAMKMERDYHRWRRAKAVQAAEETQRLLDGKGVGGEAETAKKRKMLEQGRDPWRDDPVLIVPGGYRPDLRWGKG